VEEEKKKVEVELEEKTEKQKKDKKKKLSRRAIVLIAIVVTVLCCIVYFRGEYLEYLEIGEQYINTFWQNLRYTGITMGSIFIATFVIMLVMNSKIKKGLKVFFDQEKKETPKLPNKSISLIVSIIVSVVSTKAILSKLILYLNSTQFVSSDPIFNIDIGYFIFEKPFLEFICMYLLILYLSLFSIKEFASPE